MKEKIEFLEFSLYEDQDMEELLHKRAEQGWMIEHIGRSTAVFKKCPPQEAYFKVDYFDKNHPITIFEGQKVYDYGDFLSMYDCERICGYGFRQIIRVPSESFKLYENDEKEALKANCIKRDRRFFIGLWLFLLIIFIVGTAQGRFMSPRFEAATLSTIACLVAFTAYVLPYLLKKNPRSYRKYRKVILFLGILIGAFSFLFNLRTSNNWLAALIIILVGCIAAYALEIAENKKWITRKTEYFLTTLLSIAAVFALLLITA